MSTRTGIAVAVLAVTALVVAGIVWLRPQSSTLPGPPDGLFDFGVYPGQQVCVYDTAGLPDCDWYADETSDDALRLTGSEFMVVRRAEPHADRIRTVNRMTVLPAEICDVFRGRPDDRNPCTAGPPVTRR